METKTELYQIKQDKNRLIVDFKVNDGRIKNTIIDGLAIKQGKNYLAARSHFLKVKKWAFVSPTKKEALEINTLEKQNGYFMRRVVFRLTLMEA